MRNVFKSPALQKRYEEEGYVIVPQFISKEDAQKMIVEFDALGDEIKGIPFSTSTMTPNADFRIKSSEIVQKYLSPMALDLLDDYKWFFGNFLMKYRSKENPKFGTVGLHQDPSFLDDSRYHAVNIWIPLIDTDITNGTMQIIKNTHKLNMYPRGFGESFPYLDIEHHFRDRMIPLDMKAGDAIILDPRLIHGTEPNITDSPRYAVDGVFGPAESQAWYHYFDRAKDSTIEIFEVDPNYYVAAPFCSRPDETKYKKVKEIPKGADPIEVDKLIKVLDTVA